MSTPLWIRAFEDALPAEVRAALLTMPRFRPFKEAREYARSLKLTTTSWRQWVKSRPSDIPSNPQQVYPEWVSWGDWLDTGNILRKYRPFEEAREFARSLGFKRQEEWAAWRPNKPADIPSHPEVYPEWISWGDWLGTAFLSFEEARAYVRKLGLKSQGEWRAWVKAGKRPDNIPSNPEKHYSEWKGCGDWLGTGRLRKKEFRPFEEARKYARNLGLKNACEWHAWCKTLSRPQDIPSNPRLAYSEWKGFGDWLGTGNKSRRKKP